MEMKPCIVYVKTDSNGYITQVNSSAFLPDTTGWVKIDTGFGDRYHHAQGNYFPEALMTWRGAYRYKLEEDSVQLCTAEEIARQEAGMAESMRATLEERVDNLETDSAEMRQALEMILMGVTE